MASNGTQAVDRALALLAAVVRDDGLTSAATLAGGLGLAPSSGRRLVATLERHGLIRRIAHGRYAGADELSRLAAGIRPHRRVVEEARPRLRRIASAMNGTGHLGVLEGDMVTYLVKEGGPGVFTREHGQLEAYCTGIGKALLAQLPERRIEAYLRGSFVQLTDRTLTDPAKLREEIVLTRQRGFAIDDREMADDVACIAVPLRTNDGTPMAISISGDPATLRLGDPGRVARRVARCADAIVAGLR
jgi:IclR family acetate operon transcriptional repressor